MQLLVLEGQVTSQGGNCHLSKPPTQRRRSIPGLSSKASLDQTSAPNSDPTGFRSHSCLETLVGCQEPACRTSTGLHVPAMSSWGDTKPSPRSPVQQGQPPGAPPFLIILPPTPFFS